MKRYDVKDHAPSLLPEGDWLLTWSDEFDGETLDRLKWDFRLSMMGRRHPAWTDRGVRLDGAGNCVFTLIEEDGRPVSTQLQTGSNFMDEPVQATTFGQDHLQWNIGKLKESRFTQKYGYFECRCKLQQKPGWWSAFWIQSPVIGASLDPQWTGAEVDIMECFHPGEFAPHNVFTGGYGLDMERRKIGGNRTLSPEEYHRFGLRWDETGYTFYINGEEDGHIAELVAGCPEFLLITTEPEGYRHKEHQPTEAAWAAVGDAFVVDYVRVFQRL